jgi:hypothetical protein
MQIKAFDIVQHLLDLAKRLKYPYLDGDSRYWANFVRNIDPNKIIKVDRAWPILTVEDFESYMLYKNASALFQNLEVILPTLAHYNIIPSDCTEVQIEPPQKPDAALYLGKKILDVSEKGQTYVIKVEDAPDLIVYKSSYILRRGSMRPVGTDSLAYNVYYDENNIIVKIQRD